MKTKGVVPYVGGILLVLVGILLLFYDSASVAITWETSSEVDTKGFNLYRFAGSPDGAAVQVNADLIPARGDPLTGGSYQVLDENVELGQLYYYQVEEVQWDGARRRYPEVVQARAGVSRLWFLGEGLALLLAGFGLVCAQILRRRRSRRRLLSGEYD